MLLHPTLSFVHLELSILAKLHPVLCHRFHIGGSCISMLECSHPDKDYRLRPGLASEGSQIKFGNASGVV